MSCLCFRLSASGQEPFVLTVIQAQQLCGDATLTGSLCATPVDSTLNCTMWVSHLDKTHILKKKESINCCTTLYLKSNQKVHQKPDFFLVPGQPAPRHEEGRHSNAQQKSVQQEQEEQEGRHVWAVLRGHSAALSRLQCWAFFVEPRDYPHLQSHAAPHPNTVSPASLHLLTLHTPPQHRHGANTGVKLHDRHRKIWHI